MRALLSPALSDSGAVALSLLQRGQKISATAEDYATMSKLFALDGDTKNAASANILGLTLRLNQLDLKQLNINVDALQGSLTKGIIQANQPLKF